MTILEIILAVSFGLFVVFAILVGIGAAVEQGNFLKRAKVAARIAKSAEATARMWSQRLDEESKARNELDQGVGRAVCRIISAHSEEHCLRRGTDPDSYLPDRGKEHAFIAQGMLRALNILEEETGRYPPVDMEQVARSRVGAPAHGPVTAPCVVCGGHACTYRWGQCISTWSSETNITGTFTTTRWQDFDQRFEVSWVPVCARHANDLDGGDNIVVGRVGYHRTGSCGPLPGSPIPGTKCAVCHIHGATYLIYGRRLTVDGCHLFERIRPDCKGFEWLPVCSDAKRAFDERGYVSIQPRFGGYHCG